jgi:tetratricopeptide (TPR) repeat protein
MNQRWWKMAKWIFIVVFPLVVFSFDGEAYAQTEHYKTINKDGTVSFSDNPTSTFLERHPAPKKIEPQKTPEKSSSTQRATDGPLNLDLKELSLPEKNWTLEFNFKDFQMQESGISPDFRGRRMAASNDRTKVILSVSLGPAQRQLTSKELRDYSWERLKALPVNRDQVKKYEIGQWALLEYVIKEVKGAKDFNQKNVIAYLVKDDTWINFQLSKVMCTPADERFFKDFVASARILPNFSPTSIDNFQYGNHFYLNNNYEKAIVYYKRALEQEKNKPLLKKTSWLVLVDNLALAYGLSGDLEMAQKTIQYGVSKEPTYPMFYYTLARTYARLNDLENCLLNLEKAAQYKPNMISGEKWPEPEKDQSFQRFLNNERFTEASEKFSR